MKKIIKNFVNKVVCKVKQMKEQVKAAVEDKIIEVASAGIAKEPGVNQLVVAGILIIVSVVVALLFREQLETFVKDIFTTVGEKWKAMF